MLILFDFVIHNPLHPETDVNLSYLELASGFFARLDYATEGFLPATQMSGFSQIAADFVRRIRFQSGPAITTLRTIDSNTTEQPQLLTPGSMVPDAGQIG